MKKNKFVFVSREKKKLNPKLKKMKKIQIRTEKIGAIKMLIISMPYDQELIKEIKKIRGIRWNPGNKCWVIPENTNRVQKLIQLFENKAILEIKDQGLKSIRQGLSKFGELSNDDNKKLEAYKLWMKQKRYSEKTINNYLSAIKKFIRFIKPKDVKDVEKEDLILYINDYIIPNELSFNFQNQLISSLKLFFKNICDSKIDTENLDRPMKESKLPEVLSVEEVKKVLNALINPKHRLMLSTVYACGLRRSELINLKPTDIDSSRETLFIRRSKGRKDRVVRIPGKLIDELRDYYVMVRPLEYLFEGQKKGTPYSPESLGKVLKKALKKAGIKKQITLHGLRHSYATHLLEAGTGIKYIQELLGHSSIKTTEIYTHISKESVRSIKSPYEDL